MTASADSKLIAEDKLVNEALNILRSADVNLEDLSLNINDCLWLAFTQPPYQLSIQAVTLLRRKFSKKESLRTVQSLEVDCFAPCRKKKKEVAYETTASNCTPSTALTALTIIPPSVKLSALPLSELRKLTNKKVAESTTPLAASLTFDEKVEKLEDLFKYSEFAPIRDVLLLEGFAEEEMDEAIEAVVENVTSMQTVQISIPSHVYNYGLESLARRGDAP